MDSCERQDSRQKGLNMRSRRLERRILNTKGLIQKTGDNFDAPFDLTKEGLNTQRAMIRRSDL